MGKPIKAKGFVTQEKFLRGRSLYEIEKLIGYHEGRLKGGALILKAIALPPISHFELRGYSQVAGDKFKPLTGFDENKLKKISTEAWKLSGPDSLVKVIPKVSGGTYPPGLGIPQWELNQDIDFQLIADISSYPDGKWV